MEKVNVSNNTSNVLTSPYITESASGLQISFQENDLSMSFRKYNAEWHC